MTYRIKIEQKFSAHKPNVYITTSISDENKKLYLTQAAFDKLTADMITRLRQWVKIIPLSTEKAEL